jgi:hypothetical protein
MRLLTQAWIIAFSIGVPVRACCGRLAAWCHS